MTEDEDLLRASLNAETGKLDWNELERHFARGVVIRVDGDLDLVDVAVAMVRDDKTAVRDWLASGRIGRANAEEARAWHDGRCVFWAVVAAPWVLVQEVAGRLDG